MSTEVVFVSSISLPSLFDEGTRAHVDHPHRRAHTGIRPRRYLVRPDWKLVVAPADGIGCNKIKYKKSAPLSLFAPAYNARIVFKSDHVFKKMFVFSQKAQC